jgi:hypothetical protein
VRKSIVLAAATFALGAAVAAAQPKKDIGYDPHANAFEQLDTAVVKADDRAKFSAFVDEWRARSAAAD